MQIWSRALPILGGTKPAYSTVWCWTFPVQSTVVNLIPPAIYNEFPECMKFTTHYFSDTSLYSSWVVFFVVCVELPSVLIEHLSGIKHPPKLRNTLPDYSQFRSVRTQHFL